MAEKRVHFAASSIAASSRARVYTRPVRGAQRTVNACLQAKIATGEIVHVDASLIRANVSWESLIERHVVEVLDENNIEGEKQDRQSGKSKNERPLGSTLRRLPPMPDMRTRRSMVPSSGAASMH
jgi:hypothetical protein